MECPMSEINVAHPLHSKEANWAPGSQYRFFCFCQQVPLPCYLHPPRAVPGEARPVAVVRGSVLAAAAIFSLSWLQRHDCMFMYVAQSTPKSHRQYYLHMLVAKNILCAMSGVIMPIKAHSSSSHRSLVSAHSGSRFHAFWRFNRS